MTDEVLLGVRIPEELKALVDADRRTNKEIARAALWREFGGKRKSALQRRYDEKQRRISMIESEKNERERELEQAREELEAIEKKLENVEAGEERDERRKRQACVEFLEAMDRTDKFVHKTHEDVAELAREEFDGDNEAAMAMLKELNEAENFNLKDVRFGR